MYIKGDTMIIEEVSIKNQPLSNKVIFNRGVGLFMPRSIEKGKGGPFFNYCDMLAQRHDFSKLEDILVVTPLPCLI